MLRGNQGRLSGSVPAAQSSIPSAIAATCLGAPPWVVFACLKCDQILKCFVAVVKINRYDWMKNLTRERKSA